MGELAIEMVLEVVLVEGQEGIEGKSAGTVKQSAYRYGWVDGAEVPILMMVRVLFLRFLVLVFGSMLTAASSSLRTMSMLSVPIPVERTSTSWSFRCLV